MSDPQDEEEFDSTDLPEPIDPEEAAAMAKARKARIGGGAGGAALGAAMLALGGILEPDKTTVEISQTNDDPPDDDDGLLGGLHFGDLPPLD